MFKKLYSQAIEFIVDFSLKHRYKVLIFTVLMTLPSLYFINQITIDTNLLKLLPTDNPAYKATKELEEKMGDGGHFIVIYEGDNPDSLKAAIDYSSAKIKQLDEVRDVHFKYPLDYIKRNKYLLIPNDYLNDLYDNLLDAESKSNPFADIDVKEDSTEKSNGDLENSQELATLIRQYTNMTDYHQSADGKIFGMLIPTKHGIVSLGKVKELHDKIIKITTETEQKFNVKSSIAGNHENKLLDYDTIINDLDIASLIAVILILILLIYSFRDIRSIILILFPLVLGLIWSFATVPFTFGSLNLITSFLTVILFGMGVDFPIHIVKRFQIESVNNSLREALLITFKDTGLSVIMSALTTAAGFIVVIFSDFRGFFEFGLLSAFAIIMIMLAMFTAFPAAIIIVKKMNGLNHLRPISKRAYLPGKTVTITFGILTIVGVYFAFAGLKFDYYLSNTEFKRDTYTNYKLINDKVEKVYSGSMSPAAIYAAHDLQSLDSTLKILKSAQEKPNSEINRIRSIRDFAPDSADYRQRLEILADIKDILEGDWVSNIKDATYLGVIKEFRDWKIPNKCPEINEIPEILSDNLLGNKGSGYYLINVYPKHERKDGKVAITLTNELDSLIKINSVKGPVGESIIFADILQLVIGEAWWIVLFGQLLVFLVVIIFQKNLKETLLMFIPLVSGLMLTFGIYGLVGIKITFFSVICIPVIMGMGVDGGIHYMNRWYYRKKDLRNVQIELFEPLSSAFLTVIFGYCGMILSSHSGLQSIGLLSSLGMLLIWAANLIFLPGLLKLFIKKQKNKLDK